MQQRKKSVKNTHKTICQSENEKKKKKEEKRKEKKKKKRKEIRRFQKLEK